MLALLLSVAAGAPEGAPSAVAGPCRDGTRVAAHVAAIDIGKRQAVETWTVELDPALCPDGLQLPDALDGAVADPPDARSGTVTLTRTRALETDASGTLAPWNAAASDVRVHLSSPAAVPLQVFSDDSAHLASTGTEVDVWWPKGTDSRPSLVWTTWDDWANAGEALARPVRARIPSARSIGELGRSLRGAELESIVSRVDAALGVAPDVEPGWGTARPFEEVLAAGSGTAAERGLVLLSMLREAQYDARPAWFSPVDDAVVPRTIPAPHLLPHPAIAVRLRNRTMVYIDPGARGARPPEVPARIRGGRVLAAGDHLVVPADTAAPRGEVRVQATMELDPTGRLRTVARITAFGAAEQALRGALDGRTAPEWPDIVGAWITPRGTLRDLVVGVEGLDALEPFAIEVRYTEPERLTGFGNALKGPIRDVIAPGLARILPPGIAIAERLTVVPDETRMALTAIRPPVVRGPDVLLNRTMFTKDRSLTLSSDWHVLTGANVASTLQAWSAPSEVLIFPVDDRKGRSAARQLTLPEEEVRIVEAMLLWRLGADKAARRQLDRLHPELPVARIAELLARYVPPGDRRPWEALVALVNTDAERIAVIDGLVAIGDQRLGWQLATALTRSADPVTRTRAFVQVARLQGPKPEASADPEGHKAWRDPVMLLEVALERAGDRPDLVRVDLANALIRAGRPMEASELMDAAIETPSPWAQAVYAEFGGVTGVYGIDVLSAVERALAAAPYDPAVRDACGRALAAIGRRREGVSQVLRAAELAGNDAVRWMDAADMAVQNGDLRAAVFAARRASDLGPARLEPAILLQRYATLAGDQTQAEIGRERAKADLFDGVGDTLEALLEYEPELELALLRHHEEEVEASRALLRRRAALHYERHMIEDAALDGSLLISRHRDGDGARYLTAGVVSRFHHANPTKLVARYTAEPEAREARMDIQLVIGEEPLTTGERGKSISLLRSRPNKLAEQAPTWPLAMKDFEATAPAGFKESRLLGAVDGVVAWSDTGRQMSVLRTERSTGDLPPPLAVLYKTGPTVLSTDRGAAVVRLDGGGVPVYAGITIHDGQDVVGLGLTPQAARDAVLYGIGALQVPAAP